MAKNIVINIDAKSNLGDVDKQIEEVINSSKTLKQQLKELRTEASNATDPESFRKYAAAAGKIKDQIDDANQSVKNFASDTQGLDLAVGAVQGLAGAFAAVTGVQALLGSENEKVNETINKVMSSLAILNGIQQVAANTLNKNSVVGAKLYAAANYVLNGSLKATIKSLGAFKTALLATGIGAIITLVGLLIANFDKLKKAIGLGEKELNTFEQSMKDAKEATKAKRAEMNNYLNILEDVNTTEEERIRTLNEIYKLLPGVKEGYVSAEQAIKDYNDELIRGEQIKTYTEKVAELESEIERVKDKTKNATVFQQLFSREVFNSKEVVGDLRNQLAYAKDDLENLTNKSLKYKETQDEITKAAEKQKKAAEDYKKVLENRKRIEEEVSLAALNEKERELYKIDQLEIDALKNWSKREKSKVNLKEYFEKMRYDIRVKYAKLETDSDVSALSYRLDRQDEYMRLQKENLDYFIRERVDAEKFLQKIDDKSSEAFQMKAAEIARRYVDVEAYIKNYNDIIDKEYESLSEKIWKLRNPEEGEPLITPEEESALYAQLITDKRNRLAAFYDWRISREKEIMELNMRELEATLPKNESLFFSNIENRMSFKIETYRKYLSDINMLNEQALERGAITDVEYRNSIIENDGLFFDYRLSLLDSYYEAVKSKEMKSQMEISVDIKSKAYQIEEDVRFEQIEKQGEKYIEIYKEQALSKVITENEAANKILDIENWVLEQKLDIIDKEIEARQRLTDFTISSTRYGLEIVSELTEAFENSGRVSAEKAFKIQKAVAISETAISTYATAQQAYASQFLPAPDPTSIFRGTIAAGLAVAAGIAKIAKIKSQQFTSSNISSGGGSSVSIPSAPMFNPFSGQKSSEVIKLDTAKVSPFQDMRVYVLENDITKTQKKVRVLQSNSNGF